MASHLEITVKNFSKTAILLLFISLLTQMITACSHLPDWIGESKKESGIKGLRISVLELDKNTSADRELEQFQIYVPGAMKNDNWYKSYGHPSSLPENIIFPQPPSSILKISAGRGAGDGQHLKIVPVIAGGRVFTISADGRISAFDAANIKKNLWRTKLKFENKSEKSLSAAGISYYNGKLYVASGYNQVDALDAATGKIIWSKNLNNIARAAPDVRDNMVFVNTIDNRIYALDASNGSILWNHAGGNEDLSVFGTASPVVSGEIVVAPYSSGEVYALQASDGREIWSDIFTRKTIGTTKMLSDIDASPIIANGMIFIISNGGVLAASDIKTGKRLWEKSVSGRQTPWISGDFLYLITNKNELACINTKSGGIKWVSQLPSYKKPDAKINPIQWSGPVMANDLLWIVSSRGKLVAISPLDGTEKYSRKIPKNIYSAPVFAGGSMYLYSDDAELIQINNGNVARQSEIITNMEKKPEIHKDNIQRTWP
jgi:hypothetical protein